MQWERSGALAKEIRLVLYGVVSFPKMVFDKCFLLDIRVVTFCSVKLLNVSDNFALAVFNLTFGVCEARCELGKQIDDMPGRFFVSD